MTALYQGFENSTEEQRYQGILELRAAADGVARQLPLPETIRTEYTWPVGAADSVKVTVFRPLGSEDEMLPIVLYCHGGGWLLGSVLTHGRFATDICIGAHAAVVFVEYSLSPEVKFPVANEQVYGVLEWLLKNAQTLNMNPAKIAIAGDSAGGNMSAVISMMAKDRGLQDAIKAQILLYPAVSSNMKYASYETYGNGDCYLSLKEAQLCIQAYLGNPAVDMHNKYAIPMLASVKEMEGLPAAFVLTCECDILRDEGEAYAAKLTTAHVYTSGMRVLGAIHGFFSAPLPETPQYRNSLTAVIGFIKDQLKY
ncbi:hypothetical protein K501DRAFT_262138 [Backusella circina FSU 941]|nr:hypothetical protein K501DRAFT_262138 [Backusella circina FSU 941]